MKHPIALAAILAILAGGCAPFHSSPWVIEVQAYDQSPSAGHYPQVPVDRIIVYAGPSFAPKKFELLARLKSAPGADWLPEDAFMDEFKKKAAQLGADAVVMVQITHPDFQGDAIVETGQQPRNDLGYSDHSHNTGVTVVVSQPTREVKDKAWKLCKGYALAIRSKIGQ